MARFYESFIKSKKNKKIKIIIFSIFIVEISDAYTKSSGELKKCPVGKKSGDKTKWKTDQFIWAIKRKGNTFTGDQLDLFFPATGGGTYTIKNYKGYKPFMENCCFTPNDVTTGMINMYTTSTIDGFCDVDLVYNYLSKSQLKEIVKKWEHNYLDMLFPLPKKARQHLQLWGSVTVPIRQHLYIQKVYDSSIGQHKCTVFTGCKKIGPNNGLKLDHIKSTPSALASTMQGVSEFFGCMDKNYAALDGKEIDCDNFKLF